MQSWKFMDDAGVVSRQTLDFLLQIDRGTSFLLVNDWLVLLLQKVKI